MDVCRLAAARQFGFRQTSLCFQELADITQRLNQYSEIIRITISLKRHALGRTALKRNCLGERSNSQITANVFKR